VFWGFLERISSILVGFSVSNPVYTDTGIPVFGTPNTDTDTDTDTGKNVPVFAGIEKD
jgi:hypothetical protein